MPNSALAPGTGAGFVAGGEVPGVDGPFGVAGVDGAAGDDGCIAAALEPGSDDVAIVIERDLAVDDGWAIERVVVVMVIDWAFVVVVTVIDLEPDLVVVVVVDAAADARCDGSPLL